MPDARMALEILRREKAIKEAMNAKGPAKTPAAVKLPVEVIKEGNLQDYLFGIKKIGNNFLLIGIPGDTRTAIHRRTALKSRARKLKKNDRILRLAKYSQLSNAYLLRIFEKGSPLTGQPPRPVMKPALFAKGNKEVIAQLVAQSANAYAEGKETQAKKLLNKAGIFGVNAIKKWFKDSRNQWEPNAPSTIEHKGKDQPGIDSDVMRNAFTYVLRKEK